ncbi:hypothetical protein GSI_05673 [Ganoderma sinense ZZ0214-1]|uniref:Uncharacterized protein n=1 Tax=Ganoderma sinense ZZ0214-1 TaxID=1077348 RepID=A0A2G8SB48_9APHY|nr:hypothetical protein GSI_05673 [Ganoderma sinense ZZ0214-1]
MNSFINSVANQMGKGRSTKPGKSGPNEGVGLNSPIDGAGGKSKPPADSEATKPITPGPHPPSPPESPKQRRISLSSRLTNLNTYAGASSTGATGAPTSSTAGPSIRDPTAVAVADLLGTMQNTLKALGNTFDVLGEQTIRVASLGPAVDALTQIESVQVELSKRTEGQDQDMQEVKTRQLETVKDHLRTVFRPRVNEIVAACVQKEIETRLTEQIPASLRDWLLRYRLQIMEAKRNLHNSEARRHNALIRSSGLDEPLKPLLRPLQFPVGPDASADTDGTPEAPGENDKGKQDKKNKVNGDGKDKGKDKLKDKSKPADKGPGMPTPPSTAASVASATTSRTARTGAAANRLSVNTAVSASTSIAAVTALQSPGSALGAGVTVDLAALGRWDAVPATASPGFPHTLAAVVSLTAEHARALVREYGLVSAEDEDDEDDKDENVNPAPVRGGKAVRGGPQGENASGRPGGVRGGGPASGQGGKAQRPASMATACSDASSWANAGLAGTREDDINKFMRYIGVGFQVLPATPIAIGGGTSGGLVSSPLVERRDCAFIR